MFRAVLDINPDYVAASVNLGYAYLYMGHVDQAVQVFTNTVKKRPVAFNALYGLALSYQILGKKEKAIASWQLYIQKSPDSNWKETSKQNLQRLH